MKNTMKKIIGVIMILAIMVSIVTVAHATNKEPMKDYERVLMGEGFKQSEDDDTIWYYNGAYDGYQMIAFYDAFYDSGCAYAMDLETGEIEMITFKWQPSELEFESIADYDF